MPKEPVIFSAISFNLSDGLETVRGRDELRRALYAQQSRSQNVLFMNFPEAYRPGTVEESDLVRFSWYLGHVAISTPYETADGRPDDHVLLTTYDNQLVSQETPVTTTLRLATRNAIQIAVNNELVGGRLKFIGGHLDDRREVSSHDSDPTETSRLSQVRALLGHINPEDKTILAFDFNALHKASAAASLAPYLGRFALTRHPESIQPDPTTGRRSVWAKMYDVSNMAIGTTMQEITAAGFSDADKRSLFPLSTVKNPAGRFGPAIDHILSSTGLKAIDFRTFRGPSDHRGIAATFEVEPTID